MTIQSQTLPELIIHHLDEEPIQINEDTASSQEEEVELSIMQEKIELQGILKNPAEEVEKEDVELRIENCKSTIDEILETFYKMNAFSAADEAQSLEILNSSILEGNFENINEADYSNEKKAEFAIFLFMAFLFASEIDVEINDEFISKLSESINSLYKVTFPDQLLEFMIFYTQNAFAPVWQNIIQNSKLYSSETVVYIHNEVLKNEILSYLYKSETLINFNIYLLNPSNDWANKGDNEAVKIVLVPFEIEKLINDVLFKFADFQKLNSVYFFGIQSLKSHFENLITTIAKESEIIFEALKKVPDLKAKEGLFRSIDRLNELNEAHSKRTAELVNIELEMDSMITEYNKCSRIVLKKTNKLIADYDYMLKNNVVKFNTNEDSADLTSKHLYCRLTNLYTGEISIVFYYKYLGNINRMFGTMVLMKNSLLSCLATNRINSRTENTNLSFTIKRDVVPHASGNSGFCLGKNNYKIIAKMLEQENIFKVSTTILQILSAVNPNDHWGEKAFEKFYGLNNKQISLVEQINKHPKYTLLNDVNIDLTFKFLNEQLYKSIINSIFKGKKAKEIVLENIKQTHDFLTFHDYEFTINILTTLIQENN
ncbi:MAG: hypothetical protein IT243_01825 [Bacteroidia bacterium]|nr:hypothetical protein [Bacteroidia bacterium]